MIRASVPKLNLDDAFEQKNEIAKAVEDQLEKVVHPRILDIIISMDLNWSSLIFAGHVCLWIRDCANPDH